MWITTQGEYGLRCIIALARHAGQGPLSIREIAKRENLSKDYVAKLLHRLKESGLVQSVHGTSGGYVLSRHPSQVTVKDVVLATEGDFLKIFCLHDGFGKGSSCGCEHLNGCGLRQVWHRVYEQVHQVMSEATIELVIQEEQSVRQALERCV